MVKLVEFGLSLEEAALNPGKTRCSWISGFAKQGFATLGFSPRVVMPFCKMSHMVGDVVLGFNNLLQRLM